MQKPFRIYLLGLTLILDINHKEYLPGLTAEEGIRILIGDQDEPLFPVEKGISIEPGVSASISIRKVRLKRLLFEDAVEALIYLIL